MIFDCYAHMSPKYVVFIFSSNLFDRVSPVVSYKVDLAVLAAVEIRGSVWSSNRISHSYNLNSKFPQHTMVLYSNKSVVS